MTRALDAAVAAAAKLPPEEQDALGTLLLEEIASETRWADLLSRSPALLEQLADEALEEHEAGRTKPLEDSL